MTKQYILGLIVASSWMFYLTENQTLLHIQLLSIIDVFYVSSPKLINVYKGK